MRSRQKVLVIFSFLVIFFLAFNVKAELNDLAVCPQVNVCGLPYECGAADGIPTCPTDYGSKPTCPDTGDCCDPDDSLNGPILGCGICCNPSDCTCTDINADGLINNIDFGLASSTDLNNDGDINVCDTRCVEPYLPSSVYTDDTSCDCSDEGWTCPDWSNVICIGTTKTRTCTDSTGCTRDETLEGTCGEGSCDEFVCPILGERSNTGLDINVWRENFGNNAACSDTCACPPGTESMTFTYQTDLLDPGDYLQIGAGSTPLSRQMSDSIPVTGSSNIIIFQSDNSGSYTGGSEEELAYEGVKITAIYCAPPDVICIPNPFKTCEDWPATCPPDTTQTRTCTTTDTNNCPGSTDIPSTESRTCPPAPVDNTGNCGNFVCPAALSVGSNVVDISVWQTNYGNDLNDGPGGVGACSVTCNCPAETDYTAFTYQTVLDTSDILTIAGTGVTGSDTTTKPGGSHSLTFTSDSAGSYLDGRTEWNGAEITQINCIDLPPDTPPPDPGDGIVTDVGDPEEVIVSVKLI